MHGVHSDLVRMGVWVLGVVKVEVTQAMNAVLLLIRYLCLVAALWLYIIALRAAPGVFCVITGLLIAWSVGIVGYWYGERASRDPHQLS